ncbi:MAG TPA: nucleoside hydrolase [Candidatus Acidoferrum sp.]|nr:nucleoside hydrolase [Candidatus Acidoferrum sp.]
MNALSLLLLVSILFAPAAHPAHSKTEPANQNWSVYGGDPENTHYSPLSQINRDNVKDLGVAWEYDTGETGGLETSPLIVDGILYGITPSQKIFALNAATGKLLWKFDSGVGGTQPDRGLGYWSSGSDKRIFVGIMNFVYALDAETGKPVPSFGKNGRIDLRENLGRDPKSQWTNLTSPGIVYQDLLIVGGRDPETLPAPPGDIRAYDVRTGKLRWSFHTIPHPGEFGYSTWPRNAWKYSGAANNWAGMALDPERGIVYVPTGSAAFDFYGKNRIGNDLFADCLIALDAKTGKRIWHFQDVRHDLWDRDFPAPPALLTLTHDGKRIDAVAQTTKQGFVYVFNRVTGEPLFPIEDRKVPPSDVPGELAALEQPFSLKPAAFARQHLTADMLTDRTPEAHRRAIEEFRKFRSDGQFVPFSVGKDTVVFPGFDGGAEWGGPAVDPATGILYVNANEMAWTGRLEPNTGRNSPRGIYMSQCSVCHGDKMVGSPPAIPALANVGERLTSTRIRDTIRKGKGRMNGFPNLSDEQVSALVDFLTSGETKAITGAAPAVPGMNYRFGGYKRFLDPQGYPAIKPPWGTLSAIDLNTGEYVWKINLGEYPALAKQGLTNTGSENYGGPIVTAGGLVFIAATDFDRKFRAFDKSTGKLLWETMLPFAGNATPATYAVGGRQYVAIAAGGGKDLNSPSGGVYVAFALPQGGPNAAAKPQAKNAMARASSPSPVAADSPVRATPEKIIIDTDIGDDIDDAFAVALALRSPELQILGITTTFGDTALRAKLADRLLAAAGREDIPVAAGAPTPPKTAFTQRAYAEGGNLPPRTHPPAVDFILDQIRRYPGEITLVEIGPTFNVGALIDRDPMTFRKLRRVVMMGGSIERGYGWLPYGPPVPPEPEWNVVNDIPAAQKLFASGVPIYLMPLDSTQLKLDEVKREFLFRQGKPLTDALTLLYHEWGQQTPTLFDPMTIAYILRPEVCPVQPMDIQVDAKGYTRRIDGKPDADVCLNSDRDAFFNLYLRRVAGD